MDPGSKAMQNYNYESQLIESRQRVTEAEHRAQLRAQLGPAPEPERPRLFSRRVRPLLATVEVVRPSFGLGDGPRAA